MKLQPCLGPRSPCERPCARSVKPERVRAPHCHSAQHPEDFHTAAATRHIQAKEKNHQTRILLTCTAVSKHPSVNMSEVASTNSANSSQTSAADNKEKASEVKPQEQEEEVDIDLEAPETEKAALAIQNQFRRFQKKKK
uniref:Uncharacterized protein n=1 Tax=Knipowitschia caucasica TaxID=637954 RepID=A0AAV2KR58_KNICA